MKIQNLKFKLSFYWLGVKLFSRLVKANFIYRCERFNARFSGFGKNFRGLYTYDIKSTFEIIGDRLWEIEKEIPDLRGCINSVDDEFIRILRKIRKTNKYQKKGFNYLKEMTQNHEDDFAGFRDSVEIDLKDLKKSITTLKRNLTRQTNEQNKEKKAFLKLMNKSEDDFKRILKDVN